MYAIVEIAGLQYKVEKDQRLYVNRLNVEAGKKVKFDRVLLIEEKGDLKVGAPVIDGAVIEATVNSEVKGDKVLIFKKKRRKGYQKMNGHRQIFTSITINKITAKAPAKKAAAKATEEKEAGIKIAVTTITVNMFPCFTVIIGFPCMRQTTYTVTPHWFTWGTIYKIYIHN